MASKDKTHSKRLIVSGVPRNTLAKDLFSTFSAFGSVCAVDGLGLVDGNGDPRKYAFLTLETTDAQLHRCMKLLNGSKWKGSTLRIGEARPDFTARLKSPSTGTASHHKMNSRVSGKKSTVRKRLLRGTQGKLAQDMRPTTLENVGHRPGWRRTPLDHLIRPLRMRPEHPLPPTTPSRIVVSPAKSQKRISKKIPTPKNPLRRAKVTIIDPSRYGAIHLTAASGLLGGEVFGHDLRTQAIPSGKSGFDGHTSAARKDVHEIDEPVIEEHERNLGILGDILDGKDTVAWEPDSDLEELARANRGGETDESSSSDDSDSSSSHGDRSSEGRNEHEINTVPKLGLVESPESKSTEVVPPLKAMFTPGSKDTGFKLCDSNWLESDVEMDDLNDGNHVAEPTPEPIISHHTPAKHELDPKLPFFFPLLPHESTKVGPNIARGSRNTAKDGSRQIHQAHDTFSRVYTDDEMRQQLESIRDELTSQYKQRHREATRRLKQLEAKS